MGKVYTFCLICKKMKPLNDHPQRHAYLLRCWQERGSDLDSASVWRFSLEEVHTQARRGFASLEALVAYLQTTMADDGEGQMKHQKK